MKRFWRVLVGLLLVCFLTSSAMAVEIIPKDGEYSKEVELEPMVTPEPNAVLVGSVWVYWNDTAYSKYGCSIADINYTNPNRSNIGVTFSVGIFDGDMIKYFGTTFRTSEEVHELALKGYEALQNGISLSSADYLVQEGGIFEGMMSEDIVSLDKAGLAKALGEKSFIGMNEEELMALDEVKIDSFTEIEKLTLAQLGGYNFYTYYMSLAEAGVINPGYALYQIELHTLPGAITIPKGEYDAVYVLNGYDAIKNELSDFFIHLPVTLQISEDVPEELLNEYGITMAKRIDI